MRWDVPLLEGYPFTVLNNERGQPLTTWNSLHGKGIFSLLRRRRPRAVLLCQFNYAFSMAAYHAALTLRVPIWIRMETQDEASKRPLLKSLARDMAYRALYWPVSHAFFIGARNREHLLSHGFKSGQLTRSPYCVPSGLPQMAASEKEDRRLKLRASLKIPSDAKVIGFFGKLIDKKNPELLVDAVAKLPEPARSNNHLLFVGAGELEGRLKELCARHCLQAHFPGFVNQSGINDYYLAADLIVLPSRYAGETWGLVVNEALHAGCAVIVSEAVGCAVEFGTWERVRVIPVDDAAACADAIQTLSKFPRDFDWCAKAMEDYSIRAAAEGLASKL